MISTPVLILCIVVALVVGGLFAAILLRALGGASGSHTPPAPTSQDARLTRLEGWMAHFIQAPPASPLPPPPPAPPKPS